VPIHIGLGDAFPEFPQFLDAGAGRIARNDGGIKSADRYAGNPVGIEVCLVERLIDASLISPERAAALQDERNALEWRTIAHSLRIRVARSCHAHPPTQPEDEAAPHIGRAMLQIYNTARAVGAACRAELRTERLINDHKSP
jgi:hypothetical protein